MSKEVTARVVALPTISSAQADDLKVDTGEYRLWVARVGVADGAACENDITVEHLRGGRWRTVEDDSSARMHRLVRGLLP